MLIKRRSFIKLSSLASASIFTPKLLLDLNNLPKKGNKVLVVLQMSGANDGLNTVIPIQNDVYYKSRPNVSIAKKDALSLSEDVGLNPALPTFKKLFDEGQLGILNGVGYPDNSRSHFRSMDIWHSASTTREYLDSGWIGRYLDVVNQKAKNNVRALEVDDLMSLALKGEHNFGLALEDPKKLFSTTQVPFIKDIAKKKHDLEHQHTVDYLYQTLTNTVNSAEHIFEESKIGASKLSYPRSDIGQGLKTIASLILSDIETKVYYISVSGFDTHNAQLSRQKRLFEQIDESVAAFVKDLKDNNRFEDVLLMTFSEFGRRVEQNGSNGTDHGAASCMFLASGALKKSGILSEIPSLTDLHQGDLKYSIDFKQVYATILDKWLDVNPDLVLNGYYKTLDFI
jgi:uncharacterized protein (DUF1501 family)